MTKNHNIGVNNTRDNDNTDIGYNAKSDNIALKPYPKYNKEEWCYLNKISHTTTLIARYAAVLYKILAFSKLEPINASLIKRLLINSIDILLRNTHI